MIVGQGYIDRWGGYGFNGCRNDGSAAAGRVCSLAQSLVGLRSLGVFAKGVGALVGAVEAALDGSFDVAFPLFLESNSESFGGSSSFETGTEAVLRPHDVLL